MHLTFDLDELKEVTMDRDRTTYCTYSFKVMLFAICM